MQGDALQRAVAEFVGAFTLIFIGVGAIAVTAGGDLVAVALAHGLAIGVMVSALGHISGGHFNPAVTLGFLITGRLGTGHAILYWIAQLAGAVVAALAITWPSRTPSRIRSRSASPRSATASTPRRAR